jgi:cytoskeleton protein RodZ
MAGLGEDLRAAREARNLTLSDISERIHIRTVYLQNLEREDWKAIGAPVYVRGFLRTYARFLGIDPEASVARFNATLPAGSVTAPASMATGRPRLRPVERRGPSVWLWVVGAIAAALVAFVAYNYFALHNQDQTLSTAGSGSQPAATAQPSAGSPAPPTPKRAVATATPLGGPSGLGLRFLTSSWVRVTVDGTVAMEGTYPAGTKRAFRGKTAAVRVGNAAGVALTVNGRDLGALGPAGAVVDRSFNLAQE